MDAELQNDIADLIAKLGRISKNAKREAQSALSKAAAPLADELEQHAPVSEKPHSRYSNGEVVATYYPGNLGRSFRVLRFKRAKSAVFVGAKLDKNGSKGTFRGNKTDGYYLGWQEYGAPLAGIPPRPFVKPVVEALKSETLALAVKSLKRVIVFGIEKESRARKRKIK